MKNSNLEALSVVEFREPEIRYWSAVHLQYRSLQFDLIGFIKYARSI